MIEPLRYETIVVPTDFSDTSRSALELAKTLASGAGPAEIVLAHAQFVPQEIEAVALYGPQKLLDEIDRVATSELGAIVEELRAAGIEARFVTREGRPDDVILAIARDESADAIVIGTHGRRGVSHLFLGSVAERVLRQASCPVATVPPASHA